MKRLLAIVIGIGVVLGTVSFAQDTTGSDKKMSSKKKVTKKKATGSSTTK